MTQKKVWLDEVSFMRPFLLVLLVSYHAFAPFVGTWPLPEGIHNVDAYWWIAQLSRAFRLEGFVFISGYIFTFQLLERKKFPTFGSLLLSKVQRLLIPSIFFSILYFICFKEYAGVYDFLKGIMGGVGHLWYLPCLFVCFLVQYALLRSDVKPLYCILFLSALVAVSFIPLPLRMNKPLYYMLFFYGGGLFYRNSQLFKNKATRENEIMAWVLFVCCFVVISYAMIYTDSLRAGSPSSIVRGALYSADSLLKAVLGWTGILAFYLSAARYCKNHHISDVVIRIGTCGYGVYVIHQFILVYLYRYTALPVLTGTYLLPWVGFVVTVLLSTLLTLLIRQTSIGRKYL